jgi:hypothetical protein
MYLVTRKRNGGILQGWLLKGAICIRGIMNGRGIIEEGMGYIFFKHGQRLSSQQPGS